MKVRHQVLGLSVLAMFSAQSLASVVISGTRVIYPSDAKEVSVKVSNPGANPVLLQSWIDNGDANASPGSIKVPFALIPPVNRVEAGQAQTLRISYTGGVLPMDKESVFFLNVLEVPKKQANADKNALQLAFRSRIKLFYRPTGLQGNPNEAAQAVTWQVKGNGIQATNPTPYYVSFVSLTVGGKQVEADMLAPHGTKTVNISGKPGSKISGDFLNDYGALSPFESVIK